MGSSGASTIGVTERSRSHGWRRTGSRSLLLDTGSDR